MCQNKKYFIGLDFKPNSVAWAVADEDYNLLRAKNQTLWGSRLFSSFLSKLSNRLAIKHSARQAAKIINHLIEIRGENPTKIFLKITPETTKKKGETPLTRKDKFIKLYNNAKITDPDAAELLKSLEKTKNQDLQSKKLYLYYTQMGRCAYCGEKVNLEELMGGESDYDIDHIFPRSKTKDDSITRNLVLVHREHNKEKDDDYPINPDWQKRMQKYWPSWYENGLITKAKYDRLVRTTPLTLNELTNFLNRQLVETAEPAKTIHDHLAEKYPNLKILLVKADQTSDFYDHLKTLIDNFSEIDLHHAKIAYLNIIVGNVIHETFTEDPCAWLKNHPEHLTRYSITPDEIWCTCQSRNKNILKGWNYATSIETISKNLKKL